MSYGAKNHDGIIGGTPIPRKKTSTSSTYGAPNRDGIIGGTPMRVETPKNRADHGNGVIGGMPVEK